MYEHVPFNRKKCYTSKIQTKREKKVAAAYMCTLHNVHRALICLPLHKYQVHLPKEKMKMGRNEDT